MAAPAGHSAMSSSATARARNADAVEGIRMRRGPLRVTRARVTIGTSAGFFNRFEYASGARRYFVEKPIVGLSSIRGLHGRGPRSEGHGGPRCEHDKRH